MCVKEIGLPLELKFGQTCLLCSRQEHTSHQFTMKYYISQLSLITFLGMRSKSNANSPFHKSFMIWWTTFSLPSEAESTGEDGDTIVNQEVSAYNTVKALNGKISHLGTSTAKILILGHWDVWVVFLLWPLFLGICSLLTFLALLGSLGDLGTMAWEMQAKAKSADWLLNFALATLA